MDIKGYANIPRSFCDAITFLAQALPKRSVPTFLELLFGAMLTQNGFFAVHVKLRNPVSTTNMGARPIDRFMSEGRIG